MPKPKKTTVIIDTTTGVLLDTDNLYVVELNERQLAKAEKSEDAAFNFGTLRGIRVNTELMLALHNQDLDKAIEICKRYCEDR